MSLYRKKPVVIEAREVTYEELDAVARWCGGDVTIPSGLNIPTLEGTMHAQMHDWIIRGVQGEFYPCKPDIFEATYEPSDPIHTNGSQA
jgi:hypothetical protein